MEEQTILSRKPNETEEEYCNRIMSLKDCGNYTWTDIAVIINDELGWNFSSDKYRKSYAKANQALAHSIMQSENPDIIAHEQVAESLSEDYQNALLQIKKEKVKLSDERSQISRLTRILSREETLKEIAHDAVETISKEKVFTPYVKQEIGNKIGILCISDVHYGIDVDIAFNKYNPEIAKRRLQQLMDETISKLEKEGVKDLCVVNMGDLIAGRIHLPIRLNSRIDTVTQTMEISEIMSELLYNLSEHFNIHYMSTGDNHGRISAGPKEDSIDKESFTRLIDWYIKERCKDFVNFINNEFGDDIATFNVGRYRVAAVHGDKPGDKQYKLIENLSMFTQTHYDLILSAHLHHPNMDVQFGTTRISNGSLMGTDSYASDLRCFSKPSQNLIIMSDKQAVECLYTIELD